MKKLLVLCTILLAATWMVNAQSGQQKLEPSPANYSGPNGNLCSVFGIPIRQTNVTCYGGANGNVIIYSLGGTRPYAYNWSPTIATSLPLDTIDIAGGMAAGSYSCTITDAAGCTFKLIVTITQPPKLTLTTSSSTNDKCNGGNNGSANVVAGGGVPSYSYAWAPSVSTTNSASNLTAGNYIVTVTDSNKCTTKDTVTITQPVAITTVTTVVSTGCTAHNGSITLSASNGVAPYSYYWSPGGNTTTSISGLSLGNYTCTVTDANGCTVNTTAIISDSTTLKNSLTNSANVKCYGDHNGIASFNVTGGLGTHDTYLWMPVGGTNTSASGLSAGTYSFTATDSVGCKALSVITITQPHLLSDSMVNIRNIACYGAATGRVTVGVSGGTSPYTYVWSTNATTAGITGLAIGTYTVGVTDNNGCVNSASITLTQPATAVADSNHVTSITCYGGKAIATVYAYGGVHPYKYTWAPGTNTTNSAVGLSAGTYIVTVRDSNNCRLRDTITITQPASFIVAHDTSLKMPCNNKAWVQVSGSLSTYTFSWSPSGGTKDTAANLCVGVYVVTITNAAGCVETDTIKIVDPTAGVQQYSIDENIKIYPVPASTQINVDIKDNSFALKNIAVFDVMGREIYTQPSTNTNSFSFNVSEFPEGTYFLKLTGNGERIVKFFVAGK